jgi:hypothetical protein
MYACIHETGRGFFTGVCTFSNTTANFHDPPPSPDNSRIDSRQREAEVNGADRMPSARSVGRIYEVRVCLMDISSKRIEASRKGH